MEDTGVAGDASEHTDDRFKELDHHIRSASTLGHMLSQTTKDFAVSPGESIKESRTNIVHRLLNGLAQCLNRTNQETVAVGLIQGQIKAINQDVAAEGFGTDPQKTVSFATIIYDLA